MRVGIESIEVRAAGNLAYDPRAMTPLDRALRDFDRTLSTGLSGAVIGVDEVGRGCLAGPVVAAAVTIHVDVDLPGIDDSKRLSGPRRARMAAAIRAGALAVGVSFVGPAHIDAVNIRRASLLAMRRAVLRLEARLRARHPVGPGAGDPPAGIVLVDGVDRIPELDRPQRTVIGGDGKSRAIAAASIVAKTVRDRFMERLAAEHPAYGFERNRGYGTPEHLDALRRHGPCPWHRRSFAPIAQHELLALADFPAR